ncbi:alpha/beta hydrolase fold domain-containing protein [Microbacterium sp. T2.11-28]|uniref:alpha/beta hydrolase fold domain-containing protein n=1 Tax=unclassified Microbacterium TaxID=2609290 RepID=UPI002477751B|nr:alpha/beta hydrolase fold domain-containing protein [Microbacterium sp. T2.11-28]CAI9394304.1 Carboxylesterase NlhH [Microbacterium sp. T2.11-28]
MTGVSDEILDGPHGPLRVRIYRPDAAAAPAGPPVGLVWAHGGGFAAGDIDMPEGDGVARALAGRGIAVVSVDYRLAPPGPGLPGFRHPVASEEVGFAFAWAAASGIAAGPWAIGGASAGANLATGATLRLLHRALGDGAGGTGTLPALVALAYPTLHAVQPAPDAELRAALDADPEADRFGPEVVRGMYENLLGAPVDTADVYAVPGLATPAQLTGFPPVLMVNSDADELRVSGEAFAATLRAAGADVEVVREPGTQHGHLNRPAEPAAGVSIGRFADRLLALASPPTRSSRNPT